MSIRGLDVSEFQGIINWDRVKDAGYRFAMIRAGYGFGTLDRQFRRNASECTRIGLPFGVYWFCYATDADTARREADGCINAISRFRIEYPIAYDIEQASLSYAASLGVTYTPDLARSIVTAFCDRLEDNGYFAMFYTNRSFLDTYLGTDLARRYALWYARYTNQFDGTDCGIWQYSDQGRIPGIDGDVDLDLAFVDYPDIIRRAGLNHLSDRPDRPTYITYVIQPGDTLSQIAKRYGTTVEELARINDIRDPNLIYAGDTIRIPERRS